MPRPSHHTASPATTQALDGPTDLWSTEIVPHLPADLEQQARILGAFQRRRAVACASDLLRTLLASVLVTTSFRHLGAWAVVEGLADISAPAWHKRLLTSSAFLLWLLDTLLAPPPPPVRLVPRAGGNILLVDATVLAQHGGSGDDWRLHTAYNFSIGRLVQVSVTDRHSGEHLGSYRIQPGDIVVADNGYGYRGSVATVRKQQGHLVIRVRPTTFPFEQADGQTLDVVAQLRKRGPNVRAWQGWCRDADGERYRVRLLAAKLPAKQAAAARRRVRQNAHKHGRTVQTSTLLVAGWVLLITTLEATEWDAPAVLRLYRVRWQVECTFKDCKSNMFDWERGRVTKKKRVLVLLMGFGVACWVLWLLGRTHEHIPRCKATTEKPQLRRRNILKHGAITFCTRNKRRLSTLLPKLPAVRVLDYPRFFLPAKTEAAEMPSHCRNTQSHAMSPQAPRGTQ